MYIYALVNKVSHTDLIAAFQQGSPDAFAAFYRQYGGALRFYAEQLVKDRQVAEDIATDSFIKTFHRCADFSSTAALKRYLYVSVSNASLDYLKTRKRHDQSHREIQYLAANDIDDTEVAYIRTEVLQAINAAIDNLPEKPAEVLRMLFIQGKKLSEIAKLMDLSYNTVQNYRAKALELIRIQLIKDGLLTGWPLILALSFLERH